MTSMPSSGSSARISTAAPTSSRLADGVQQRVDAVGAVDVGDARAARTAARCARVSPDVGVAGGLGVVVGLGLDDHARGVAVAHDAADEVAARPRAPGGRRTATVDSQQRAGALELLADARQRRAALADLGLQPRASCASTSRGLLAERRHGDARPAAGPTRPPRARARRRRRGPRGTACRA